jgi:hypothetical protein
VVGFFFSSLCFALTVAAQPGDESQRALTATAVLALELEAKLASKPDLYVVVDLGEGTFKVKSRGVELSSVKLGAAEFLNHEHSSSQGLPPIAVPSVLTLAGRAPAGERRVILPRELRPYNEDDEGTSALPNPKPGERLHKAPSEYRVRMENGWWLEIAQASPVPPSGFEGFKARVRQGWDNLLGGRSEEPALFFLQLPVADAQRIHHLFRPGRAILVTR